MKWLTFILAVVAVSAADLSALKTADELWKHIEELQQGPREKPQTREEMVVMVREFSQQAEVATKEFEERYPQDTRRWEGRLFRLQLGIVAAEANGRTPDFQGALPILKEIAAAPDASPEVRRNASTLTRAFDQELQAAKQLAELKSKPVDLKFTAVDGQTIDLTTLRGKVVLVDFWATWCGPCRVEIPNLVKTHQQYHAKGFEVVGISLDQNKEKLLAYTKEKGMTWPQYFDGKGWDNDISRRFGIEAIPAMWLLDKTGKIRSTEARGPELAKQVEKLLAE